jgi:hypothetical protein
MAYGLQTWDANGNLLIDTSTIIGRIIGVIDASAASGSATVAGLDQGTPFAIPQLYQGTAQDYGTNTYPDCTFSGNTVSWTRQSYPSGVGLAPCNLILGVR